MYLADVALAGSIANKGAKSVRFYSVRGKKGDHERVSFLQAWMELLGSGVGCVGC